MKGLAGVVVLVVAATLAAGVESARACSCALPDARTALARSDGAFVGRLESRRESGQEAMLVFSVERALKGSIGRTVTVVTPASGASCGIELTLGTRAGLVLDRAGGAWRGSLCAQFDPSELLQAALPLPAPNGRGPVALVVGGEFGDVRLLALDRRGRTLAYGRGGGRAGLVAMCPGRGLLTELAYTGPGPTLVIRRAATLRVVRRHTVALPGQRYAQRLMCANPQGSSVVVFARGPSGDSPAKSGLYRLRAGRIAALWTGAAYDAAFTSSAAYLSAGPRGSTLVRIDLASGRTRTLATIPAATGGLALDPAGTRIAGVSTRLDRSAQVVRVDLSGPRAKVTTARIPADEGQAQVFWLGGGRLLFAPSYGSTARVLDAGLRTRSRFGWRATTSVLVGRQLFGTDFSLSLYRADLPSGPQSVARRLPGRAEVLVAAS
jgi:hypothetical protein